MAKYVPDVRTQRWVVIAQSRIGRPQSSVSPSPVKISACPFCYGNESLTPPETYRIGDGEKDQAGWKVRVVPNKYPITDIHEVIIHSPDHEKGLHELPLEQVARVLRSYRDRYRAYEASGQVLIFCNHGFHAGASLAHPHSQLVVVPRQINLDALTLEPIANVIENTDGFVTYCPDFSQWPYEVWLVPSERSANKFSDVTDDQLLKMAPVFQTALLRINKVLTDPAHPFKQANEPFVYNYYIYHGADWFIRIIPRAVHRAGFELGTGLSVNVVDPSQAAERLINTAI